MAKRMRTQILQFSFIGILNAVVDIVSLNLLLFFWATNNPTTLIIFNTISYTLAILNSYIWNKKYTFRHNANSNYKEFGLFIIQAVIALLISNIVFIGMIELIHSINMFHLPNIMVQNISKGTAMFLSSSASFIFMKYFVFRKKQYHTES
ncbi:GtrA family protein [Radiobacillus sp. PE A8.2]|uniref:GtrA family protein n=1 Tax=Radiobacillus sp. PE A8.2 TaxID=3380349 RepID=UPI00388F8198